MAHKIKKKFKTKIAKMILKYRNGNKNDKEILDAFYDATRDINRLESMPDKIYPNLLTWLEETIK